MQVLGSYERFRQFMYQDLFPSFKHVRNVPQYARKKEQPRNEKCKCGSGLKYKNCCGK